MMTHQHLYPQNVLQERQEIHGSLSHKKRLQTATHPIIQVNSKQANNLERGGNTDPVFLNSMFPWVNYPVS